MNQIEMTTFLNKAKQQLGFLHDQFYADFTPLTGLELAPDTRADKRTLPTTGFKPVALGDRWEGRDSYYWLRFKLAVPALAQGSEYVLHTRLGRTGGGGNSGFEGLIYLDGQIIQAVDSNHEDLYLDADYANATHDVAILLWTGLEGGGVPQIQHYTLEALCAGVLHSHIVDAYAYLQNIIGVITELSDDAPIKYDYIRLVHASFKQLIWADATVGAVDATCAAILNQIQAFIAAHPHQKIPYTITAVGHTHIDVAWLWRLKHTREKITRSFATVLKLMDEYPDYHFFQSTPQDYAYLEQDQPELFAKIKQRVQEGRWEANGGTWLEPDTNVPSGESLTRQFLYGAGYFQDRFAARQNVLWLPDVFGYSAALPQIMQGFGIDNFMTTKISWNDTNRMPHDTFYWQGIDGSRVLTHFVTTVDATGEYKNTGNWAYTYNGDVSPHTVFGSYHVYADKGLNDELLLSYGFGDGGGGPTRQQIQNVAILNALPGVPSVHQGRVDDYFDRLNARLTSSEVSTWRGELYLEFHRGTYTGQAWIKAANRRAEEALRRLEMRYTEAHVRRGVAYPTTVIRGLWETLLRNQFHDILPGSSIHEVYVDAKVEFADLFKQITELEAALADQTTSVLNPLTRTQVQWLTADGQPHLVAVPGMSAVPLSKALTDDTVEQPTIALEDQTLVTDRFVIGYAADGQLHSVVDRRSGRDFLDGGGNILTVYEDRPLQFDNWNIDADYPDKATVLHADHCAVVAHDETGVAIRFDYHFGHSTITQTMRVHSENDRIDFVTHVDWHEHQVLLRVAFNSSILADNARFDIQYGNVLRPVNDNTSWDVAKFETVGHKWADLSQADRGVALLNDSKYGYRVKDRQLSLSLIKSGINPDYDADTGTHDFTYALLPHDGDWLVGEVEDQAAAMNQPLAVVAGAMAPLFSIAGDAAVVDAVKMSESGAAVVLRLHENNGQNSPVTIQPNFTAADATIVALDETTAVAPLKATTVTLSPYQVLTVRYALEE